VASSDDRLLTIERNEIAKIARELKVEQSDHPHLRAGHRTFIQGR
jgi:hypothetical protein